MMYCTCTRVGYKNAERVSYSKLSRTSRVYEGVQGRSAGVSGDLGGFTDSAVQCGAIAERIEQRREGVADSLEACLSESSSAQCRLVSWLAGGAFYLVLHAHTMVRIAPPLPLSPQHTAYSPRRQVDRTTVGDHRCLE